MHPLFRIEDPLPVAPGLSPFHVRGLYYDRVIARVRKDPGGLPRMLAAIDDERVRQFCQQKFSWNGWYDVFPVIPIYRAIAANRGVPFETAVLEGSRLGSLEVIPSIFRLALRVPSPQAVAAHVAQIVASTMDFIDVRTDEANETRLVGRGLGVPLFVAPHNINLFLGFMQAVLEMRGDTNVRGRCTQVEKDGTKHGFDTVSLRYEFDWDARKRRPR